MTTFAQISPDQAQALVNKHYAPGRLPEVEGWWMCQSDDYDDTDEAERAFESAHPANPVYYFFFDSKDDDFHIVLIGIPLPEPVQLRLL